MKNKNHQHIATLLSPSAFSTALIISLSGLTVALIYIKSFGSSGAIQEGLLAAFSASRPTYTQLSDWLAHNSITSNAAIFLFWAAVGYVVYLLATNLMAAFNYEVAVEQELNYVNTSRASIIRFELTKALIRLAVLAAWLVYLRVFFKSILPYVVAAAGSARLDTLVQQTLQLLATTAILFIAIHLNVVFLRLLLLKTRVFADRDDI